MKNKTKIILGISFVIVAFAAIVVAGITGAIYYTWKKIDVPEKAAKREKAKIAGVDFAKNTDQNGCLRKGLSLNPPADSFDVSNITFVEECLKVAAPNPNFCDGVPLIFNRDWFNEQCQTADRKRDACISTLIAKRNFCHS